MDYQVVFQDAMRNVKALSLDRSDGDKTSIFSGLANLALAAKRSNAKSLEPLRELLDSVLKRPVGNEGNLRYMSLKVADWKEAINTLLCDEQGGILGGFSDYSYDHLLQYIEICKRAWQARYYPPVVRKASNCPKPVPPKPQSTQRSSDLSARLLAGDVAAAKSILDNRTEYNAITISMAESVLKKKR